MFISNICVPDFHRPPLQTFSAHRKRCLYSTTSSNKNSRCADTLPLWRYVVQFHKPPTKIALLRLARFFLSNNLRPFSLSLLLACQISEGSQPISVARVVVVRVAVVVHITKIRRVGLIRRTLPPIVGGSLTKTARRKTA